MTSDYIKAATVCLSLAAALLAAIAAAFCVATWLETSAKRGNRHARVIIGPWLTDDEGGAA